MPPITPLKAIFLTGQNDAFTGNAETVPSQLTAHARTMEQGIYQVAENFFVAAGYGQSNMTMAVGADGVLIIDCLETEEHARQALSDLRRFSDKPIKALIYSHSHPDHISGVKAVLDPTEVHHGSVQIYAHERLLTGIHGNPSLGLAQPLRLAYTFGLGLDRGAKGWIETGLGTQFGIGTTGFLMPTHLFQGKLDIEVAGIRVQLHEAPSESDDEIVVMIIDPWGTVLATAPDGIGIAMADIDFDQLRRIREELPSLANRRPEVYDLRALTREQVPAD